MGLNDLDGYTFLVNGKVRSSLFSVIFQGPPFDTRPSFFLAMRIDQLLLDPVAGLDSLARRSLHLVLRHAQTSNLGFERDQQVVQEVHAALLRVVDTAIREELHSLNSRIWRVPNIPNEIWSEIWGQLTMHDRIVVTHVCRDWRRLALESPTLWSNIDFEHCCNAEIEDFPSTCRLDESPHSEHGGRTSSWTHIDSLPVLLERGRAPLRFSLKITGYHLDCTESLLLTISEAINTHAQRLVSLEVVAENQRLDFSLFLVYSGPFFPKLTTLSASEYWEDGGTNIPSDDSLAMDARISEFTAPILRTAELKVYSPWIEPLLSKSPFFCVRTATFRPIQYSDVLNVLRACPQLASLHLDFYDWRSDGARLLEGDHRGFDHTLEDLQITDLPLCSFDKPNEGQLLDILFRPSRRSIHVSFSVLKVAELASGAFLRALAMFTDLSRDHTGAANETLVVTVTFSEITVEVWKPWAAAKQRRSLNLIRSPLLDAALALVWKTLDMARICTFELRLSTIHGGPLPSIQCMPLCSVSELQLFAIQKPIGISLGILREADLRATVPKACRVQLKNIDGVGAVSSVQSFGDAESFLSWLSSINP